MMFFGIIAVMAEENTDQSQKNRPAATVTPPVGTRLPDEPGKPKRRRRRRRSRSKRTQLPDSVTAGREQAQVLAQKQSQARLGSLDKELNDKTQIAETKPSLDTQKELDNNPEVSPSSLPDESQPSTQAGDKTHREVTTLPELRVNGKPYRPAEKRAGQTSAKVDKKLPLQEKSTSKKQSDSSKKPVDVEKKVHLAFAGKKEVSSTKKIAGETIYETRSNERRRGKNNKLDKNDHQSNSKASVASEVSSQSKTEAPILGTSLTKTARETQKTTGESSRQNEKTHDKESDSKAAGAKSTAERFTPRLATGLKGATPTFSLQDIQRTRRRHRLWGSLLFLILLVAAYFLWAGVQRARQSVGEIVSETNRQQLEQSAPASETPMHHAKATLSGKVIANSLYFPSITVDRIAIYIRYGGENSFRDTGIRLMRGEERWSFSQANEGETYEIQAVLIDNGRQIAYSDIATATAPAAEIVLTFAAGSGEMPAENIRDNLADQAPAEPVLQLSESPTISGVIKLEGDFPVGAQVVIWLGEDHGGQVRQDAYTFGVSSSETAYTISELKADVNYVMDAVLQSADGQVLGLAGQSLLARSPATDANFVIKIN